VKLKWNSGKFHGSSSADTSDGTYIVGHPSGYSTGAYDVLFVTSEGTATLDRAMSMPDAKRIAQRHFNEHYAARSVKKPISDQTISISIDGKKTPVRVMQRPDETFAAGYVSNGRSVIGVGKTREEAMHAMLANRATA
jgi:hypothetical protein